MPELKAIGRYNRLAMHAANQGRRNEALWYLSLASRLSREAERPLLEAVTKNNMGIVFQMSGQGREACLCFRMALNVAEDGAARTDHPLRRTIRANLDRLNATQDFAAPAPNTDTLAASA